MVFNNPEYWLPFYPKYNPVAVAVFYAEQKANLWRRPESHFNRLGLERTDWNPAKKRKQTSQRLNQSREEAASVVGAGITLKAEPLSTSATPKTILWPATAV
ncbi:hypothetical protein PtA15_3A320 [Puccinia triticina]|uniref:Uncharacterized protein n=1 Tax=Puccinia triticina TaxID=208348 RepID=A0ABY7CD16_9BASI|nr:uncharacterized protein PtA15_3A320 [Puccinia triticina]WAQ82954.1 hypothetical protein PtA15_3A320 [Puccinia triticina]